MKHESAKKGSGGPGPKGSARPPASGESAGPWDVTTVKHLINGRVWNLEAPHLAGWIEVHGGVEAIWDYLRSRPLSSELRRLLELILEHPGERASFYLERLPMHRATFSEQLTRLCATLAAQLNGWAPALPALDEQLALQTLRAPALPSALPRPPTALIGRARELAECCALLRRARVRLLTLSGPGGIGKTRLALEIAEQLREEFWLVVLVELAPISQPEHVLPAIALALGIKQGADTDMRAAILERLHAQPALLLLDNFEHLLDAAPQLSALLAAARQLKLLVTSRAMLRLSGEHELVVPPLSLPEPGASVAAVESSEAGQLFLERARALRPDLRLDDNNREVIAAICRRLDGVPLAIELAAARCKHFAPEALAPRLSNSLALLTNGPRDLPARQQTLRATMLWSYDLLSKPEQRLLAQLATFQGGCDLEAAARVCDAVPAAQLLDALCSLVDKSLLRQQALPGGEPRFLMLETIREFALEQLEQHNEADQLRGRHAACYLALAEQIEPLLTGPEQARWLRLLAVEHENLRAALRWALSRQDELLSLRMIWSLWNFWKLRGLHDEGLGLIEQALAIGAAAPVGLAHKALLEARARCLIASGWLSMDMVYRSSRREPPRASFARSLDLAYALEDDKLVVMALQGLGSVHELLGSYQEARACFERSLAICQANDEPEGQGWALNHLASITIDEGNLDEALDLLDQSVALLRQVGHRWGVGVGLMHQGIVTLRHDRRDYARKRLGEALKIIDELEDRPSTLKILRHLSILAVREEDHVHAASLIEAALEIARQVGDLRAMADLRIEQGRVARRQGALDQARQRYAESLRLHQSIGRTIGVVVCLEDLGELALEQGQPARACTLLAAAQALRQASGQQQLEHEHALAARLHAQLRAALGDAGFAAAWEEGRRLAPDQAARFALDKAGAA